jgi:hypothetical protein
MGHLSPNPKLEAAMGNPRGSQSGSGFPFNPTRNREGKTTKRLFLPLIIALLLRVFMSPEEA